MSRLTDWYEKQLQRIEREKESDREVARLAGMTIEEFDKDTTKPDPID